MNSDDEGSPAPSPIQNRVNGTTNGTTKRSADSTGSLNGGASSSSNASSSHALNGERIRWADEDGAGELAASGPDLPSPRAPMVTLRSGSSKKKLLGKTRDHFHLRNKAVATARPDLDAATRARAPSFHAPKSADDRNLILRGLRTCALFDDLTTQVAVQLKDAMRERSFDPGAAIVTQGSRDDDAFYVLVAGAANVVVDGQPVRTLGPGDPFGEVSLIYNTERTATVRATGDEPARVFELRRERYALIRAAEADATAKTRLELVSGSPTLGALDPDTLRRVAESMEPVRFTKSTTIFSEGEIGDALYVVESGEVSVSAGGTEVRRFGRG